MRAMVLFAMAAIVLGGGNLVAQPPLPDAKKEAKKDDKTTPEAGQRTPAAELTRTKALKTKMSVSFTDARLGDVLKEFANRVDTKADVQLLWTYGPDFPYTRKVSYACKDKPLDAILDEMFKKTEGNLGYLIVSKAGDKRDGWVLLTTNGERGVEKPAVKLTDAEEEDAADKLALGKKLIGMGKSEQAKTVLAFLVKKYPTAKVVAEAKELLAKLEK